MSYTHLHLHTEYSLLDGLGKIKDYVARAKALGMTSLAITDHGVANGLVEFYSECKAQGIKPILGCEFYEAPTDRTVKGNASDDRYHHLVLLVKNETGYRNLCRLVTRANTEGFYYKPRIDRELLERYHEGLICLSGCVSGRIAKDILSGDVGKAKQDALWYRSVFHDDFYLEVQNHGLADEAVVAENVAAISKETGIPMVVTNDCHYVLSEDAEAHDWLLALQTKLALNDPKRMRYEGNYSLRPEAEMRALFPQYPEAYDITEDIAGKCSFDFEFGHYRMPKVIIPPQWGDDYYGYMESEARKGLEKRFPLIAVDRKAAEERLAYELSVIKQMNFAEYFLDTRATIEYAKSCGIMVGPGRGSGAGSILNYCLGITDVNPLEYGLYFERFLNPSRVSMPDIDVDYDRSFKADIIQYERDRNGASNFAKIQTFQTMASKAVVKDCARVYGFPPAVGAKFSKLIGKSASLEEAWKNNSDLRDFVGSDKGYEKVWNIARKLEGTKRSASTHACGHIPTPVPCEELFPCSLDKDGLLICQYDMTEVEHLGNLKKDLLMLRNLTIIDVASKLVKSRTGLDVPMYQKDLLNDKEALAMIAAGDTDGVFQLEESGMRKFMTQLKPKTFADISAGVALYRPGPMDYIPEYLQNRKNPNDIKYEVPALAKILGETYGVIVYQEQAMEICRELAGFSMAESDVVRKGMAKKKQDVLDAERGKFIYGNDQFPGCVANGIPEQTAIELWDKMKEFGKYAFNKSHSVAYAFISMQTAYLKAHFPLEYYAGLLTSVMDKTDKLAKYVSDVRSHGITLLPPDVNSSEKTFTISEQGELLYGLLSIKGLGEGVVDSIIDERKNGPFTDLYDFMYRLPKIHTDVVSNLVMCGAFDACHTENRASMLASVKLFSEDIKKRIDKTKRAAAKLDEGQLSLFDLDAALAETYNMESNKGKAKPEYIHCEEFEPKELLEAEKKASGMFLSSHPLDAPGYPEYNYTSIMDIRHGFLEEEEGEDDSLSGTEDALAASEQQPVYDAETDFYVRGIVTGLKEVVDKRGGLMAFLTIEDTTDAIEVPLFASIYAAYKGRLAIDDVITVLGNVTVKGDSDISLKPRCFATDDEIAKGIFIQKPRGKSLTDFADEVRLFFKSSHTSNTTGLIPIYVEDDGVKPIVAFWSKDLQTDLNDATMKYGYNSVSVRERLCAVSVPPSIPVDVEAVLSEEQSLTPATEPITPVQPENEKPKPKLTKKPLLPKKHITVQTPVSIPEKTAPTHDADGWISIADALEECGDLEKFSGPTPVPKSESNPVLQKKSLSKTSKKPLLKAKNEHDDI